MNRNVDRLLTGAIVGLAIVAAVMVAAVVLGAVPIDPRKSVPVDDRAAQLATPAPRPTETSTATSTATPDVLMPMGAAHIPTSADCMLCHETDAGVGIRPVPVVGHPLEGWANCTACHSRDRLVKTAPGHAGIAQTECLNCHKPGSTAPAITRPHSLLRNTGCLTCHGGQVHLPATMVGRTDTECWLCHQAAPEPPPQFPHRLDPGVSCRTCHAAGKVGALPADHAARTDTVCVLCHDVSPAAVAAPTAPHSLSGLTQLCVFCHGSSNDGTTR